MKKRLMHIGLALASALLLIGMVFCIVRPAYVKEAVQILLKNELSIEPEESDSSALQEESSSEPLAE